MNELISVIVPVYNVEKYLEKCVESILAQTYRFFELILVDDGSTDKSGAICDSFLDTRIKVIHKNNGGLSEARNMGTMIAKGDYITWIDSDDVIQPEYLEILLSLIKKHSAKTASCEFLFVYSEEWPERTGKQYEDGAVTGMEALKMMLCGNLHGTSACGLLLDKNIALQYLFPLKKYHEDDMTTYKFLLASEKVAYTKEPLYIYYQRSGSIMHRPFSEIDIHLLDAGDMLYDDCNFFKGEYLEAVFAKKTSDYLQILFKYRDLKKISPETHKRIQNFVRGNLKRILHNKFITRGTKIKIGLYKLGLLSIAEELKKRYIDAKRI